MARKLVVVENELERSEKRIDDLTFENSKLKDEIRTYSNELKSFEAADEQYSERETQVINHSKKYFPPKLMACYCFRMQIMYFSGN